MKYEVIMTQERTEKWSDGSTHKTIDDINFLFDDMENLQVFINLVSMFSENININIKFIKEEF